MSFVQTTNEIDVLIVVGYTDVRKKGLFWSMARKTELVPTLECPQLDVYSCASRAEVHEGTARQCPLPVDIGLEVRYIVVFSLSLIHI